MWENLHVRQAETGQQPDIPLIGRLARLFGLCIDNVGTVHAARRNPHHHALITLQQLAQAKVVQEGVLGRHMALPPLAVMGLTAETVATSTLMPGSIRMPFVSLRALVVTLNSAIGVFF